MTSKRSEYSLLNRTRAHAASFLVLVLSGGLLCLSPAVKGQSAGVNQNGPEYIHAPAGLNPMPQHGSGGDAQIEQMRLAERQKRVAADTAKLVQLSNELKSQVDQAPKDQISLDMVRKAAEIEKLAHDLNGWLKS
jgi:hypothetical protein